MIFYFILFIYILISDHGIMQIIQFISLFLKISQLLIKTKWVSNIFNFLTLSHYLLYNLQSKHQRGSLSYHLLSFLNKSFPLGNWKTNEKWVKWQEIRWKTNTKLVHLPKSQITSPTTNAIDEVIHLRDKFSMSARQSWKRVADGNNVMSLTLYN